ncbi:MAG TPA: hypothetical protein VLF68_05195 [Candidatus Saccharimonadales bacterium]|nr:hypothetical protein [Candidatus Saccharimonadales bacterium]
MTKVIVAILLVAGIGLFAVFSAGRSGNSSTVSAPQTTISANPSAATKTYTNKKFGFSISYPDTLTAKEYPDTQNGAGFYPAGKENDPASLVANITVNPKIPSMAAVPFDQYVKTAATQEIQGYQKLNSIQSVKTASGITGYETTWIVAPPPVLGTSSAVRAPSVSLPITYFPLVSDPTQTVQVSLSDTNFLHDYNAMLTTFSTK